MSFLVNYNFMFMWFGLWIIKKMLIGYGLLNIYFRSDELSWRASSELLVEIAGHGEDTGFEVPCLIIAAKDDMDSFPMALEETVMVFAIDLFIYIIIYITERGYCPT